MRFGLGLVIVALALPLAAACSSAKTPDSSVDSGTDATKDSSPADVGSIDSRPVDDGAIPPKCPTWHPVTCGGVTCAVGSICAVVSSAPPDAGADAGDDSESGPVVDAAPESGPISVEGTCIPAPESCATRCPSTDCVCVAWSLAKDCAIDSKTSCPSDSEGIVPVVYCVK
jgi:hypothetical protein